MGEGLSSEMLSSEVTPVAARDLSCPFPKQPAPSPEQGDCSCPSEAEVARVEPSCNQLPNLPQISEGPPESRNKAGNEWGESDTLVLMGREGLTGQPEKQFYSSRWAVEGPGLPLFHSQVGPSRPLNLQLHRCSLPTSSTHTEN